MSSGKVNCTCGWSWNKSDSSAKDMYICHECGRDNSNNMKNGGWLDNYGTQANYNDSKATASPDMRGDGFSNVGRNYSPAWGGSFQEGGEIPMAQKGKKVKYVESKNDPRYKAYQDSLALYKTSLKNLHAEKTKSKANPKKLDFIPFDKFKTFVPNSNLEFNDINMYPGSAKDYIKGIKSNKVDKNKLNKLIKNNIKPIGFDVNQWKGENSLIPVINYSTIYKKPQEEVLIQRPQEPSIINAIQPTSSSFNINASVPQIRQQVRQPKYYDIQENINQPFGGSQTNYRTSDLNSITSPDDLGPGNTRKIVPHYQKGGKLKFLQPTSDKLPEGYRIPYDTPSTERASSIGGTNGEPAYLVPEFKYGQPIYDSIEEFKRTGEHLGGPFKTWQEAEEWENTVRHPAVENRETIMFPQEKFQTGGSLPGSVGFTYARTKGIPSNGPYAKKTLPSAQNGVDMYGNPITAELKYDQSVNRTNYNPRTNQMIFGNDMPYFLSQEQRDKTLAHENRHAWQFANDRTNFNIVHTPEYAFQDSLKKKPEQPSTDEVFHSYHDRKQREVAIDVNKFKARNPELSFMSDELIYKKFVDSQQYDNPLSVEGEAQYYENTGERSFQNGGEMKFYQHGLDFKPKSISRDGTWLNKYDQAQNGKKKFKLKDERLQAIKPSESTFVKKRNFEAEQAKVQRTYVDQVGKQMAEEKRRKKLTKDQREREDYNARNEQTGSIQTPVEESTWDRTKAIVSNPLTAFGYAARNQSLPTRFQHGERNTLDNAIDWVNPLQGAAALSEIPGELGRGEFLNAGLSALDAADLGVYARGAKQLRNINPEGKIFNGLNKQLDDIAIKNTEKYMAKRTPSNTPLSKEMNPQLVDNFDPGEYAPFQEDDYMKWFNEQKSKINPRPVKQHPLSILRRSSVIGINDMKEGGVIKDDMGQWKYPGQITEIGSNQITMQGVPYDVLGISDTGDTKLMKPGKDYKFKGKKVTEFPMAKNGRRQEQKGLQNLEDLTNFTNYNKPSNWLNKYN